MCLMNFFTSATLANFRLCCSLPPNRSTLTNIVESFFTVNGDKMRSVEHHQMGGFLRWGLRARWKLETCFVFSCDERESSPHPQPHRVQWNFHLEWANNERKYFLPHGKVLSKSHKNAQQALFRIGVARSYYDEWEAEFLEFLIWWDRGKVLGTRKFFSESILVSYEDFNTKIT